MKILKNVSEDKYFKMLPKLLSNEFVKSIIDEEDLEKLRANKEISESRVVSCSISCSQITHYKRKYESL